eukprot:UN12315
MRSWLTNSTEILAIFYWRQTINTWCKTGKAVSIRSVPNIIWIDKIHKNMNKNMKQYEEKENELKSMSLGIDLKEENNEINMDCVNTKKDERESSSLSLSLIDIETKPYTIYPQLTV